MYNDRFVGLQFFMHLLYALAYLLTIYEIPRLSPFSMNKYMSIFIIFSNFTPVILNIASHLNPGELK